MAVKPRSQIKEHCKTDNPENKLGLFQHLAILHKTSKERKTYDNTRKQNQTQKEKAERSFLMEAVQLL